MPNSAFGVGRLHCRSPSSRGKCDLLSKHGRPRRFRLNPHLPVARTAGASPEESPQARWMSLRKVPGVGEYSAIVHRFPGSARASRNPRNPSRQARRDDSACSLVPVSSSRMATSRRFSERARTASISIAMNRTNRPMCMSTEKPSLLNSGCSRLNWHAILGLAQWS